MTNTQRSPVSPIELAPLRTSRVNYTPAISSSPIHGQNDSTNDLPSSSAPATWLPFTLKWYYMIIPSILSLALGIVLAYLTWYSKSNYGLGANDGSSAMLFGWRFTPTLVAVLYAQMTVILFEDVKRTEPFARLAKASQEGASAYGTVLQTPRAWWSVFMDVCFRRKRTGKTSWSLTCAALVNFIALLAISPLSSALLSSEEVPVPKAMDFTRVVPIAGKQIPLVPSRETYFRTMSTLMRNVSTSAWVNHDNFTYPFWPSSEMAQFGPSLSSAYGVWEADTTTLRSEFKCQDMTLESAELSNKRYSKVYSVQGYGPYNGTQPMVTFALKSGDGCRYELSIHPLVDLAYNGGITWSNASTFYPVSKGTLALGGKVIANNVTSTHVYARVNASQECNGRDIVIMSLPWTAPVNFTQLGPFKPENMTFERSSTFRMRGMLCNSHYSMSNHRVKVTTSTTPQSVLKSGPEDFQEIPQDLINTLDYQKLSLSDDWRQYFDGESMQTDATRAAGSILGPADAAKIPGFSGMAPLLAALSGFNLTAMMDDPNIVQRAATIKGRFFMETIRETLTSPEIMQSKSISGRGTSIGERVVVLKEIGITLAVLLLLSSILLAAIFWTSRLPYRPLNLQSDPASTVGLSALLKPGLSRSSTFRSMHSASRNVLYTALQKERYLTADNTLLKGSTEFALVSPNAKPKRDWRPRVIHLRMLLALSLLLILVMVAVLILNAFSMRSRLSQTVFIYEADISKFGLSFSKFAPISIAPTIVSVVIGLWWDQLDMTFRILQPYIAMSSGPTSICAGAGLTYRSKTWVGAAFKAARYRHWVLFMVAVGSVLAQVLTVSMSALFERESTNVSQQVTLQQNLDIRQVPLTTEVALEADATLTEGSIIVLNELYLNASKNWLYGAAIQQSFNGSQLPWTSDGWSFLPLDTSDILKSTEGNIETLTTGSLNMTVNVPAIRARLECKPIKEISNVSSWLVPTDLAGSEDPTDPPSEQLLELNRTGSLNASYINNDMFPGTNSYTTARSSNTLLTCCANGTITNPGRAAIGYWSPIMPPNWKKQINSYPHDDIPWPVSIATKFFVGKPINVHDSLYFKEVPQLQAARCEPVIETAEASILIDVQTSTVRSFTIKGPATAIKSAWENVFTHNGRNDTHKNERGNIVTNKAGLWNITTSFGVLFLDSLLGAADRSDVFDWERWSANAFVIRDPEHGINMDLMTYSMYTMANKDPEALLNYTTLTNLADRTFQNFFQQFVSSGLSLQGGGYAYQKIDDQSMEDLRRWNNTKGTHLSSRDLANPATNRTVPVSLSNRVRVLHMNAIATYLSTAILIWLVGTTFVIIIIQRRYTSSMLRDVQLIADMLVLVAGSDNFLELVQEKGVALKRDRDVKTMLGWFRDRDGQIRWGVEVVGGRNAVDWVDAPKTGWHVRSKRSCVEMLPWKSS